MMFGHHLDGQVYLEVLHCNIHDKMVLSWECCVLYLHL